MFISLKTVVLCIFPKYFSALFIGSNDSLEQIIDLPERHRLLSGSRGYLKILAQSYFKPNYLYSRFICYTFKNYFRNLILRSQQNEIKCNIQWETIIWPGQL